MILACHIAGTTNLPHPSQLRHSNSNTLTLKNSGHFSSVENPQVPRIVLSGSFKTQAQQLQS